MIRDDEYYVVKANKFVQEYRVGLSLAEMRIVNYLIANIRSPKYDTELKQFEFDINEFCSIVYPEGIPGNAYKWVKDTIQGLADKSAWKWIEDTENPKNSHNSLIRWIDKPKIYPNSGKIILKLDDDLAPHLLNLDKNFFEAKFKYTVLAKSKYTIPLYELLKSWEKVISKKKAFTIDELREYMDAQKKSQKNLAEFKRTALDPAVKEINDITDLLITYKEIKNGRKTEKIEFVINAKEAVAKPFKENEIEAKFTSTEEDDAFARTHYGILVEEFPEFNGNQIKALFAAAYNYVNTEGLTMDEKQEAIAKHLHTKLRKIDATPERTKTTRFYRLLDAVEKNY